MTRNIRILLAGAISLMVIAAVGLAALMLIPAAPKLTGSIAGAIGGPFALTAADGRTTDPWGSTFSYNPSPRAREPPHPVSAGRRLRRSWVEHLRGGGSYPPKHSCYCGSQLSAIGRRAGQ
jgi:hypothetical protein